jgi:hypothetical protein
LDFVALEHDLEDVDVGFPMPFDAFLAVFLETLLAGVDVDQRLEAGEQVFEFGLFFFEAVVGRIEGQFVVL